MSAATNRPSHEFDPQEPAALLQRILAAVEKDQRGRWAQIVSAVVLSLATMATAWCAYQSTLWNGVQTFRLAAANKANSENSKSQLQALQLRVLDAVMGMNWMQAKHDGNHPQEQFLFNRFRPEMKRAVEAWLKTDPFNNPKAPLGPFLMAEYVQPELGEARRLEEQSEQELEAAQQANRTSDAYVLLTVLFASVLFFGGIAGTIDSRRIRVVIVAVALSLFLLITIYLSIMPICRE